jgi:hypothetical protein
MKQNMYALETPTYSGTFTDKDGANDKIETSQARLVRVFGIFLRFRENQYLNYWKI